MVRGNQAKQNMLVSYHSEHSDKQKYKIGGMQMGKVMKVDRRNIFWIIFFLILTIILICGIVWNVLINNLENWDNILKDNKISWLIDNPSKNEIDFMNCSYKIKYGYKNIFCWYTLYNGWVGSISLVIFSLVTIFITSGIKFYQYQNNNK